MRLCPLCHTFRVHLGSRWYESKTDERQFHPLALVAFCPDVYAVLVSLSSINAFYTQDLHMCDNNNNSQGLQALPSTLFQTDPQGFPRDCMGSQGPPRNLHSSLNADILSYCCAGELVSYIRNSIFLNCGLWELFGAVYMSTWGS